MSVLLDSPVAVHHAPPLALPPPEPHVPPTGPSPAPLLGASAGTNSPAANLASAAIQPSPQGALRPPSEAVPDSPAAEHLGSAATERAPRSADPIRPRAAAEVDPELTAPLPPAPTGEAPLLADPFLALQADVVDDLERTRIANENRLRQLTRTEADSDGESRGFGLTEDHPDVARLAGIVTAMGDLEHQAVLALQRAIRKHPLGAWVKATPGVGEKQAARLLAAIGDPYWNTLHNRPRTVSELWAYCGLHTLPSGQPGTDSHSHTAGGSKPPADHVSRDAQGVRVGEGEQGGDHDAGVAMVAARRRKGQRANWSTTAKTRAYLIATSCIKQAHSPYRAVYDTRRAHTTETHPEWTPGHSHNDALRIVSKALLRDLWRESRRLHEPGAA